MTRAELAKIFNEVDETFSKSEIYKAVLDDLKAELAAGKHPSELVLFDGAFELSKRFMFEIMSKVVCAESSDVQQGNRQGESNHRF